ncbi:MAG: plastocyanin [Roseivirga sp.]|nr:plastocyanin [Roseivirga sp.]
MSFISTNKARLRKLFSGLLIAAVCMLTFGGCGKSYTPVTHVVVIKGLKFLPYELTIRKGDTVKWINKDLVKHDVTEETNQTWTSGVMNKEDVWKMAITETTDYFCTLHVIMKGKLIVE